MAYVIGSDKGKEIAKNMKSGESYTASDGSTWTKQKDGSVSVSYQGQTYNNAYKPTTGTSGGSTSTAGNYKINSDAGKKQAQNMAIGSVWYDTNGARWQKNNDGTISVDYGGTTTKNAYTPSDYGILGQQQMEAGLGWRDVYNTYNARNAKIANSGGELARFNNDPIQQMMWNYIQENLGTESLAEAENAMNEWYENYTSENEKPEYNSKYGSQIDKLLSQILNRDDFSYDAQSDPLYQQYKQMYLREGDRAMANTMAEAAASAGGMNSYAVTAAQQAANYYNSQLNDKIPELYQLAYEMYLQDKESDVQDLGILQNMDATQYNRYRDTMSDFYNDRNFAYGMYQDAVEQGNWQTQFDYNALINDRDYNHMVGREQVDDSRYDNELSINNSRYDKETAREEVEYLISMGVLPNADLVARAGMNENDVAIAVTAARAKLKAEGVNANYTPAPGYTQPETTTDKTPETDPLTITTAPYKNPIETIPPITISPDSLKYLYDMGYPYTIGYTPPPTTTTTTTTGGGNTGNTGNKTGDTTGNKIDTSRWEGSGNYQSVAASAEDVYSKEGKDAALAYLSEARAVGVIDQSSYMSLYNEFRDKK